MTTAESVSRVSEKTMVSHQGIWLPEGEKHLQGWMDKAGEIVDGRGSYQIRKFRKMMEFVDQRRTVLDAGAHCGMWVMQMAKVFQTVHAFEPVAHHRECFVANMANLRADGIAIGDVMLHDCALGENVGYVSMQSEAGSSGNTQVAGSGTIPMARLDDYEFENVDCMKLDCEGYEFHVLRGGEKTIRRWKPTICVEQKPGRGQRFGLGERDAVAWLQSLGYVLRAEMAGDFILTAR